jgi:hypothetical protein
MVDHAASSVGRLGRSSCLVSALFVAVLVLVPPLAHAQTTNPRVLPPNAAALGLTYGEWSARWVQWAWGGTAADNPVLDTTGANCAAGQSQRVWFLAGTAGGGPVERTCGVPAGRPLFFPVGNGFCAGDGFPDGFAGEQRCATEFASLLSNFSAEVDGVAIKGLGASLETSAFRALSPEFTLELSNDNVFGAPAGEYEPGAADGVYLMLAPLSRGAHTIHFHADFTGSSDVVDVTYHLTVG